MPRNPPCGGGRGYAAGPRRLVRRCRVHHCLLEPLEAAGEVEDARGGRGREEPRGRGIPLVVFVLLLLLVVLGNVVNSFLHGLKRERKRKIKIKKNIQQKLHTFDCISTGYKLFILFSCVELKYLAWLLLGAAGSILLWCCVEDGGEGGGGGGSLGRLTTWFGGEVAVRSLKDWERPLRPRWADGLLLAEVWKGGKLFFFFKKKTKNRD